MDVRQKLKVKTVPFIIPGILLKLFGVTMIEKSGARHNVINLRVYAGQQDTLSRISS